MGESARNGNSRSQDHLNDYETNKDCSIMLRHKQLHHQHDTHAPRYTMTVKQIYGDRCMDRQISENIQINNIPYIDRINNKVTDYKQNRVPRTQFTWD